MQFFSILLAALSLAFFARPASAAFINGQNYVALADWAHANGFYGFTRDRGQEIVLTNRNSRLVFDVNSALAQINGVNVRLSFPIANAKNVPAISSMDIETALRPLIYAPKPVAKRITTICLDPGHGGRDTGNHVGGGFFGHNEKTYTLALAQELGSQLKQLGFNVVLTRHQDTYVELPMRPEIANRYAADLFVSLHFNATQTGKDEVSGPETYCITPVGAASSNAQGEGADHGPTANNRVEQRSLLLAAQIQKSLVRNLGVTDRGVRRARFAVLRDATMPAILIEGGYMTHSTEGKKIFDSGYRRQMAAAIVKGILSYQKLTAPSAPSPRKSPARTESANFSETETI